ncbi:MAG TPA: phosphate ABC transporter permease subunit PstC [Candidatus Thermoplasmatota archaeon]|nr:phosphate ABC transporter permease subunit PstC [Candidatus Thermoplasmatota archaeon]
MARRGPLSVATGWLRADSPADALFKLVTGAFALGVVALFALIVVVLADKAWPAFRAFGPGFLVSDAWDPPGQRFGAAPYLVGTFSSSLLGLAFAVPVALGTAVALAILLPRWVAAPLGIVVELLAAVPSIVFGVWGAALVAPFVADLSGGSSFGPSLLAAGFVLAVMVLPIIAAVSRDMVLAVPQSQRDAALALGATPWEVTWKVVLPYARPGILAAVILGFGRAVGETMAVVMVIGNQAAFPHSVFDPAATMSSVIVNEFGDPSGPLHYSSLVSLGLILLVCSLAFNLGARGVVHRLGRRLGVDRL